MIRADFHTHTCFSTDSEIPVREMIEQAAECGLKTLCITDHWDEDYPNGLEKTQEIPFRFELDAYGKTLEKLRDEYRDKLDLRIGVEIGLQPHLGTFYKEFVKRYPFDFVIGSVHLVNGIDPYFGELFRELGDEEGYRETWRQTVQNVRQIGDFDVLGHLDYVVRYGIEQEKEYSYRKFADEIDEILKILIERGKGLEVNTAGLKYGLPFAHPHPDILKRYRELGGEIITVGSDAHRPEHIAYEFAKIAEILQECGFRYYAEYRNRHPEFYPIL